MTIVVLVFRMIILEAIVRRIMIIGKMFLVVLVGEVMVVMGNGLFSLVVMFYYKMVGMMMMMIGFNVKSLLIKDGKNC